MARYSRPLFFPWLAPYDALWCPICIRIIEGVCLILPRVKSLLMNMCDDIALVLSVLFGKQTVYKALIFIDLPSSKPRCPMSLRARPLASICSIIYPSIDMWYTYYIYISDTVGICFIYFQFGYFSYNFQIPITSCFFKGIDVQELLPSHQLPPRWVEARGDPPVLTGAGTLGSAAVGVGVCAPHWSWGNTFFRLRNMAMDQYL
jgi:hypothetical protein